MVSRAFIKRLALLLMLTSCQGAAILEGVPVLAVPPAITPATASHIDLASLTLQAGEPPGSLTPEEEKQPPAEWAVLGVPDPVTTTMRMFVQQDVPKGSVVLSLYGSDEALDESADLLEQWRYG